MKKFSVNYQVTTSYESVVEAETKRKAAKKVKEVLDLNDSDITDIWEVK